MTVAIVIYCIVWAVSAVFVAGAFHADFKGKYRLAYEYRDTLGMGILLGILVGALGPIGCLMVILMTGFLKHGWSLKP